MHDTTYPWPGVPLLRVTASRDDSERGEDGERGGLGNGEENRRFKAPRNELVRDELASFAHWSGEPDRFDVDSVDSFDAVVIERLRGMSLSRVWTRTSGV